MARNRGKTAPGPPHPADPRLLAVDATAWAGERIARSGRREALLGRVEELRLSMDGRSIEARVRGNRPLPYRVQVELRPAGPVSRCTCSGNAPGACRHAVAALEALRFPSPTRLPVPRRRGAPGGGRGRILEPAAPAAPGFVIIGGAERTRGREERIDAAHRDEVQARRHQARRERARVSRADGLPLAWSVTPRPAGPGQTVTLRGFDVERFHCTCEDFAESELRSCSHVERVRNHRARQRKGERREVPRDVLSVWCQPRAWIERCPAPLFEVRVDAPEPVPALRRQFDDRGWLLPPPPHAPGGALAWVRRACRAARGAARAGGWGWDLDREVLARARRADAADRAAARLRAAGEEVGTWSKVVSGVRLRLHRYQEEGARFLARNGRAFLADDMGLGKTVQAVVATLLLREGAGVRRALVVCPASLKHQWRQEIAKICGEPATLVDGPLRARLARYADWKAGFLILNYELVLRDLDAIRRADPELVILDEAQRIKNWSTKTAVAVKQLASPHAFVLTGTPLENRLGELHSLVEFLHRRAAGPRWRLLPFHAVSDTRGRVIAYEGLDVLRGRLRDFFLRRERAAVQSQLPERTENTFWTELGPAQLAPYRRQAAAAAAVLSRPQPLRAGDTQALLRALTSMRILCNAHAQFDWERHAPLLRREGVETRALLSPKLEEFARVLDDLLDEPERKIVVFSQWERMLRLAHFAVRELLERRDLRASLFHGGLGTDARAELLESFHREPEFRVLFSTDAGGLGLNLQEAASVVVNLEVPWNPAVLEQRIGRVHRIGQRRGVQVLHFVTRGAIEERVRQLLESKRALFAGLLVDEADRVVLDTPGGGGWIDRARELLQ